MLLFFFKVRRVCRSLHKWLGLGLGGLLMLIALSGAALVCGESLERWFVPQRYATTGAQIAQPVAAYAANAAAAIHGGSVMRIQFEEDAPIVVWLRKMDSASEMRRAPASSDAGATQLQGEHRHHAAGDGKSAEGKPNGGRPGGFMRVFLDPATGKVLDTDNPRVGLLATIKAFHTNLLMQGPLGRNLIGICGIVLLFFALSGLVVWWPLVWQIALRFRRGPTFSLNLHQFIGALVAVPLTVIAFTGIYLAFPQQMHAALAKFAPMAPQDDHRGTLLAAPHLDPAAAFAAIAGHDTLQLSEIAYPNRETKVWRIAAADARGKTQTFLVDDTSGAASQAPQPPSGDVISENLRHLHMNQGTGPVWSIIAVATGLSPILFFITGVMSWLDRRKRQAAKAALKRETRAMTPEIPALDS